LSKVKILLKGNHAVVEGAIKAGCRYFFGYPITPQNEVLEWMSNRMPDVGGVFLQAESEVSAMNMVLGAAATGVRVMAASSGPGMDLKQEGIGNMVAHRFPCVIVNIQRGGPGNGALHPAQQDYNQVIRGGRGDITSLTLAPWNGQEMYDHTRLAFRLADLYRNPVTVLTDSVLGQVFESLDIDDGPDDIPPVKEWALTGAKDRPRNLSIAHFPIFEEYDRFHRELQETYQQMRLVEQRSEEYFTDDADLVLISYGITSRNAYGAVLSLRSKGYKVGLFRPVTLFPFPETRLREIENTGALLLVVEMSAGQMAADVRLTCSKAQIELMPGQATAVVPGIPEISEWAINFLEKKCLKNAHISIK
jgi:2-oxoglutarate/2-oxoacid ferredoxin oxidoreductase subunit alpha